MYDPSVVRYLVLSLPYLNQPLPRSAAAVAVLRGRIDTPAAGVNHEV